MKTPVVHIVIKRKGFVYGMRPCKQERYFTKHSKCPKVSHCPKPYEPGQWDRTGQHSNQRKKKGGKR